MKSSIPPQIGERFFLYHREVVVTQTYVVFHLVKIKYLGESKVNVIDILLLLPTLSTTQ